MQVEVEAKGKVEIKVEKENFLALISTAVVHRRVRRERRE